MPTPIAPGTIEVVLQCEQFGTERYNVFHVHEAALSPTPSDITAAGTSIQTAVLAHLACWSQDVHMLNVRAQDKSMPSGIIVDIPFGAGVTGSASPPSQPGNVAAVVTLRTGTGGRSGHGRVYMFGLTNGHIAPGDQVQGAYKAAVLAFFTDVVSNLAFSTQVLAVFSRIHGVSHEVTSFFMDDNLDSQRRRLPGRGR